MLYDNIGPPGGDTMVKSIIKGIEGEPGPSGAEKKKGILQ